MAALNVTSMFRSVALRNFWWTSILQLSSFLSILFVTSVVIAAPQKKNNQTLATIHKMFYNLSY